jgi:hypothetical protein
MNVFERLRRDAKKIPWGATLNVLVDGIAAHTEGASEIFAELREWSSHLSRNAVLKWTPMLATRTRCESPDVSTGKPRKCEGTAPFRCDICSRACCLAHARVDYMGDAICEVCIGQAKARKRAEDREKDKSDVVGKAFKTLGLDDASTLEEVKKRYKELVLKYNADRPQSDKKRAKNNERLKEINLAFEALRDHFEKKKAEAA